jgi:hypothetical protein
VDALPDLAGLSDDDLERALRDTEDEEEGISVRRRVLHGRIDALRAERVARLKGQMEAGTLAVPSPDALDRPIFEGTGDPPGDDAGEPLPELSSLDDDELRAMIVALEREEDDISLHRRVLHGRIDILRAERERRRRGLHLEPDELGPVLGGSS